MKQDQIIHNFAILSRTPCGCKAGPTEQGFSRERIYVGSPMPDCHTEGEKDDAD